MRNFIFGELWGLAPCHICGEETFIHKLSDEEEKQIEGMDGHVAAQTIIRKHIGVADCGKHA